MSKPTIVIVPGAWQTPSSWDGFCATTREAGHPIEFVALRTVGGTELPLASLSDDVAAVKSVLTRLSKEGKKSLLLCHSAGGVVASNAVHGFDVTGIIYLAAFMIPAGKSLLDMLGGKPFPWMRVEGDRVTGVPELVSQVAFSDLDAESQAKWSKEMTHTAIGLFASPSGYEPWSNGLPCGYIFTTLDGALPYPIQQQMASQLGPKASTRTLEAAHCPFLSIPGKLLEAIHGLEAELK